MNAWAQCLAGIELVCCDPVALAGFYEAAFGFAGLRGTHSSTRNVEIRLGDQTIRLIPAGPAGRSYPAELPSWSPLFQHIAIVVGDMEHAYAHLCTLPNWTPISTCGPQVLPEASGAVTAFKFRDPDGHPLELIAFPAGAVPEQWQRNAREGCLGVDHSAISVSSTAASIAFYEGIGLSRGGCSLNIGREQALLDNVPNAVVEVTALMPLQVTPHVELLCYRGDLDRKAPVQGINDVTATRLVLAVDDRATLEAICTRMPAALLAGPELRDGGHYRALLHDPDGHLIWLETAVR